MEQRGRELDTWDEVVENSIDAEAKANLQLPSGTQKIDQRCFRGNQLTLPGPSLWPRLPTLGILEMSPPRLRSH